MNKKVKRVLKIIGWILLAIVILFVLLVLSLRLPMVQNIVKNYAIDYIESKINTDVNIDYIYIDFPSNIVVENLFLEDQAQDTMIFAGKLDVGIIIPDILRNHINIPSIRLENAIVDLHGDENGRFNYEYIVEAFSSEDTTTTQGPGYKIDLDQIELRDIDFRYADEKGRSSYEAKVQEFDLNIDKLGIEGNTYDISEFLLKEAIVDIEVYIPESSEEEETAEENTETESSELIVKLDRIITENVVINYDNIAIEKTEEGLDYDHISVNPLNLNARDIELQGSNIVGEIESARIQEKDNLNILELHTDFAYQNQTTYLKNLLLRTDRSVLRDELILNYDNKNQLSENLSAVQISASIQNSEIAFRDLLDFMPSLKDTKPFDQYPNAVLHLNTNLDGSVDDLNIQNLNISGIRDLRLRAKGKIKNATDTDNLYFDVEILEAYTSAETIKSLLPPNTIPDSINIPETIDVTGTAKGTTKVMEVDLDINTSEGNADIVADVDLSRKNQEKYDIDASLEDLNIGNILKNEQLGSVSGHIEAQGRGFDLPTMTTEIVGNIEYLDYNDYRYSDMSLSGNVDKGAYDIALESKDPNAELNLAAKGVYNEINSSLDLNGTVGKIDLQELNFYESKLIIVGEINGDFDNINPNNLNGDLVLNNFSIADSVNRYPLRELILEARSTEQGDSIRLNSQIIDAEIYGDYELMEIFSALQTTINSYYQFQEPDSIKDIRAGQYVNFDINIKDDDIIRNFVPELKQFETISLKGQYETNSQLLQIDGSIPNIVYGEYSINDGNINAITKDGAIHYDFVFDDIKSEKFQLNQPNIQGQIANNIIDYRISTQDLDGVEQYVIAGDLHTMGDVYEISLKPEGFVLNYENWDVHPDNIIILGPKGGVYAENFIISNNGSSIEIASEENSPNSPFAITISDLKIETLTRILEQDVLPADGVINGQVNIKDVQTDMRVTSDIKISELTLYEQLVGTIHADISNESADLYSIMLSLKDYGNDVEVAGDYNLTTGKLDLLANLNKLQMSSLEGFTMQIIEDTDGYLSGKMDINGTASKPEILGALKFNDVGFRIPETGNNFRDINDEIKFKKGAIVFDRFAIKDTDGNELIVDGDIKTQVYQDFDFNLDVTSEDFKIVNSEEDINQLMYGVLSVNTNLHIDGNLDLPIVDGKIEVTEFTDFTFVVPQTSPTLEEREGIIVFVDQDQIEMDSTIAVDSISGESKIKGMDVNVEISITENAAISMIIDKSTGDFLHLKGNAELTGGIDPSGKITLVGVYEVTSGAYELNVSMVNRKFDIEKGSSIIWSGDPLEAILNITANYKTETAPIDLLQQQLSGLSPSEYNMYKQRIPFNTLLVMKGDLMQPDINFDITLNDDNPSVPNSVIENTKVKLQQIRKDESELNKQVFALLLLNRFIGENPFATESGISAESMARQSVSQILSQQLNNLASDLIAGVNLDFNFDSYDDYSQGEKNTRTDLNVGLSKRFLNDRLKITLGSKFGLEGETRQNEDVNNIAGDLNIDYMLSKDGRYVLRAYRKNEYEVALQGQIIETGVGFIINLEYDEFMDIFNGTEEKNKKNNNE